MQRKFLSKDGFPFCCETYYKDNFVLDQSPGKYLMYY